MEDDVLKDADLTIRTMRRLRLGLVRFFRDTFGDRNISLPQYTLLAVLDEKGECTMGGLADALGITLGAVTGLLDRMIHIGYVERERSTDDRRIVKARLTAKGRDTLRGILDTSRKKTARLLSDFSAEERRAYLKIQQHLTDCLYERGGSAGEGESEASSTAGSSASD